MPDPLAHYQSALAQLDQARATVNRLAKLIEPVGQRLARQPLKLMIDSAAAGFPASLLGGVDVLSIDARSWPSGEQLAQAVAELHAAQVAAQRAHGDLPEGVRGMVKGPEAATPATAR